MSLSLHRKQQFYCHNPFWDPSREENARSKLLDLYENRDFSYQELEVLVGLSGDVLSKMVKSGIKTDNNR